MQQQLVVEVNVMFGDYQCLDGKKAELRPGVQGSPKLWETVPLGEGDLDEQSEGLVLVLLLTSRVHCIESADFQTIFLPAH